MQAGIAELCLDLSGEVRQRLLAYLDLLHTWNQAFNLSGVRDLDEMVPVHLLDSLSLLPFLGDAHHILDVGSGAGLPGIPLALASPDRQFHLVDSNGKKTRFLFQVKTVLKLPNITVDNCRIEHYQSQDQIDIVTCRAFASLTEIVAGTRHLLRATTRVLAMKSGHVEAEIRALPPGIDVVAVTPLQVPGQSASRSVVELRLAGAG